MMATTIAAVAREGANSVMNASTAVANPAAAISAPIANNSPAK